MYPKIISGDVGEIYEDYMGYFCITLTLRYLSVIDSEKPLPNFCGQIIFEGDIFTKGCTSILLFSAELRC